MTTGGAGGRQDVDESAVKLAAVLLIYFDTTDGPVIAARYPEENTPVDQSITGAFGRLSGLFVDNEQRRAIQESEVGYFVEQHSYLAFLHRAVEIAGEQYSRHYFRFTPAFVFSIRPGSSLDAIDRVMHEWVFALETFTQDLIMKEKVSGSVLSAIVADAMSRPTVSRPHRSITGWASFVNDKSSPAVPLQMPPIATSPLDVPEPQGSISMLPGPLLVSVADTPTESNLASPRGSSVPPLTVSTPGRVVRLDSAFANRFDDEDPTRNALLRGYSRRLNGEDVSGFELGRNSTSDSLPEPLAAGRLHECSLRDVLRGVFDVLRNGSRHVQFPSGALLSLCVVKPLPHHPSKVVISQQGQTKIRTHRWPFGHPTDDDAVPRRKPKANALLEYESSRTVDMVAFDLLGAMDGERTVRHLASAIGVPVTVAREAVAQLYDLDVIAIAPPLPFALAATDGMEGGANISGVGSPVLDAASAYASAVFPPQGELRHTVVPVPGLRTCVDYYSEVVSDLTGTVYSALSLFIHELRVSLANVQLSFAVGARAVHRDRELRDSSGALPGGSGLGSDSFDSDVGFGHSRDRLADTKSTLNGTLSSRYDEVLALPIAQSLLWDILPLFDETSDGSPVMVRNMVRLAIADEYRSPESNNTSSDDAELSSPFTQSLILRLQSRAHPEALKMFVDHTEPILLFCGSKEWLVSRFAN